LELYVVFERLKLELFRGFVFFGEGKYLVFSGALIVIEKGIVVLSVKATPEIFNLLFNINFI